jgi:hypothetical protein
VHPHHPNPSIFGIPKREAPSYLARRNNPKELDFWPIRARDDPNDALATESSFGGVLPPSTGCANRIP